MEEQQSSHGGKRSRSGRKPVEDKKVSVCVFIPKSRIETLGSDKVKQIAVEAIEKEYKKGDKK